MRPLPARIVGVPLDASLRVDLLVRVVLEKHCAQSCSLAATVWAAPGSFRLQGRWTRGMQA